MLDFLHYFCLIAAGDEGDEEELLWGALEGGEGYHGGEGSSGAGDAGDLGKALQRWGQRSMGGKVDDKAEEIIAKVWG